MVLVYVDCRQAENVIESKVGYCSLSCGSRDEHEAKDEKIELCTSVFKVTAHIQTSSFSSSLLLMYITAHCY